MAPDPFFIDCSNHIKLVEYYLKYLHVQQTPNPLAHEPDAVPPLLVHSDLES